MRLPARLHRNRHGVFGLRVVLPRRPCEARNRREVRLTLHTRDPALARAFALRLGTFVAKRLDRISRMKDEDAAAQLTTLVSDIAAERDKVLAEVLATVEFDREIDAQVELLEAPIAKTNESLDWLERMCSKPDATYDEAARTEIQERLAWVLLERERLSSTVVALFQRNQELADRISDLRIRSQRLGLSLEHQRVLQRAEAKYEDRVQAMQRMVETAVRAAGQSPGIAASPPTGEQLSAVLKAYRDSQVAECAWTAKSEAEIMAGLNLWLRIVGDQPITRYGHDQQRNYKATLQKLPANLNKLPRYRGLAVDDVIKLADPPAAPNTVNKQLGRVSAFFEWAIGHGYVEKNPAARMRVKNPRRSSDERDQFSPNDLRKLFGSDAYRNASHREPYMFWTPLIALYTGARQTEIAQLHLADFAEIDGIPVIQINDQGEGKRVKTKASRRSIPVHPELIRLGLLDWVAHLQEHGQTRLFPELKERRDGYGQTVSKWFRRYRLRCGIAEPRKVFHSFRHTVINRLKQAGFQREHIAQLAGHENDNVTMGRYGKAFDAQAMKAVVDALQFNDATKHIKPYRIRGEFP